MVSRRSVLVAPAWLLLTGWRAKPLKGFAVDRFAWVPAPSAPADYPMWIVSARLTTRIGDREMVPDRQVINNGWGVIGPLRLEGAKEKAVPEHLSATFYSFVEDRFYAGAWGLDTDRIRDLLAEGAPRADGQVQQLSRLVVGIGPGGRVGVWVAGGEIAIGVGRFLAAPSETSWSAIDADAVVTRAEFREHVLRDALPVERAAQILRNPPPIDLWGDGAVPWMPRFAGGAGAIIVMRAFNGARDWIDAANPARRGIAFAEGLPLPAELLLLWRGRFGAMRAEIAFDADEIRVAFTRLAATKEQGAPILLIEPADSGVSIDLMLQRGKELYRFQRAAVQIYSA